MQYVWNIFEQLIPREATTVCNSYEEDRDLIFRSEHKSTMASGPEVMGTYQSSGFMTPDGDSIPVSIEDAVYDVLKQSNSLSEIIKIKFDCDAFLTGTSLNSQTSPLLAQKVYEMTLGRHGRLNLSVWMDDLTKHKVDAVVNAANEDLAHAGGLALAIVTAGGEEIIKESKTIINKERKIQTGSVVLTSGGKLPCKYVLHAVGPACSLYPHAHEKCRTLLSKAIATILDFAVNKIDVQSVAIPALSSGIYNFPLKECAEIIVQTIKEFGERVQLGTNLKEIHLVNNDEQTVRAMKNACENILESRSPESSPGNSEKALSNKSASSITVNNVCLEIVKGCIEEQMTAVIVNSVSESLVLSEGFISKAILQKAGDGLQREIKTQRPNSLIKTGGHKLLCQFVYHVILPRAVNSGAEKEFRRVVSKCLEDTSRDYLPSISFPAIGTGNLSFGKKRVADIMISEVMSFAKRLMGPRLLVRFVIYPEDDDSFKAFLDELKFQRSKIQPSDFKSNRTNDFSFHDEKPDAKLTKPTIYLGGRNSSHVEEAVSWIQETLQPHKESLLIENNHIFYFGAQEHEALLQKLDSNVSLLESLKNGSAHIKITGLGPDIIKAALEIEKLLCSVQEHYASLQTEELMQLADLLMNEPNAKKGKNTIPNICDLKKTIATSNQLYQDKSKEFEKAGLRLIKMEQIQNPLLKIVHQSKRDAIEEKRKRKVIDTLYHQVPAQFCNLVCKVGFQRIYSHSHEKEYGAGIYFYRSVKILQAKRQQKLTSDKYIYIFQADVITGAFTRGKESYIVPPPVGTDYMDLFDSVADNIPNTETFVIFNGSQTLPVYLYTCAKK